MYDTYMYDTYMYIYTHMRAFFFFFVSQKIFESSVTNAAALIENGKFGERARPHILNIIGARKRNVYFHSIFS